VEVKFEQRVRRRCKARRLVNAAGGIDLRILKLLVAEEGVVELTRMVMRTTKLQPSVS
jgi:hypothetical protein